MRFKFFPGDAVFIYLTREVNRSVCCNWLDKCMIKRTITDELVCVCDCRELRERERERI